MTESAAPDRFAQTDRRSVVDGTSVVTQAPGSSFLNSLSDSIGQLNTQMTSADAAMSDFAVSASRAFCSRPIEEPTP